MTAMGWPYNGCPKLNFARGNDLFSDQVPSVWIVAVGYRYRVLEMQFRGKLCKESGGINGRLSHEGRGLLGLRFSFTAAGKGAKVGSTQTSLVCLYSLSGLLCMMVP